MDTKTVVIRIGLAFAAWKIAKLLGGFIFGGPEPKWESESESESKPKRVSKIWVLSNMGLAAWSMRKLLIEEESEPKLRRDKIGAVAALVFATWTIAKQRGGSEPKPKRDKKKMKAPGRDRDYIFRNDFEEDPRTYFLDLRANRRK